MSIQTKFQTPVFNVVVGIVDNLNPFNIDGIKVVKSIRSTNNIFDTNPIVIEADPFLFVKDNTLYLFYEEQKGNKGKGILKMTSTTDLKNWTKAIIILEEPFHLSYPNVFEYYGKVYMMPESGHNNDVRLYEVSEDMKSCKFIRSLVQGENFVDSIFYRHQNTNYLFTSVYKGNCQYEARLYIGDDNLDNWILHPVSPFSEDNKNARCGGAVIAYKNKIFRIAQDCSGSYGGGLNAMQIDELTPNSYKESFSTKLFPNTKYPYGGHQYSLVEFNGKQIVAVDYLTNNIYIKDVIDRVLHKVLI